MVAVAESLESLAVKQREDLVQLAWRIAHATANIDGKAITAVCTRAGWTLDDFRALVARMQQRIEACNNLVAADKLDALSRAASPQIGPLNEQIDALTREYEARHRELIAERGRIIAETAENNRRASALRAEAYGVLRATSPDPQAESEIVRDLHFVRVDND